MTTRTTRGFAIGNALIACWMLALETVVPIPHWTMTALLVTVVLCVLACTTAVFVRPIWAVCCLRIAAYVLLGLGCITLTVVALTVAFLSGVHGRFLRFGIQELLLALAVVMPYLFIYPGVLLKLLERGEVGRP